MTIFVAFWHKTFSSLVMVCNIWLLRTELQDEFGRAEQDRFLVGMAVFLPTGNGSMKKRQ